jgi:hypothetical protein
MHFSFLQSLKPSYDPQQRTDPYEKGLGNPASNEERRREGAYMPVIGEEKP